MDSSTISLWTGPFLISTVSGCFVSLSYFKELSELNANNVDLDQTPRSAGSDLGLRCLPMSLYRKLDLNELKVFSVIFCCPQRFIDELEDLHTDRTNMICYHNES